MAHAQPTTEVTPEIKFYVMGAVPSKKQYRYDKFRRAKWKSIKEYQAEVGKAAMAGGAAYARKEAIKRGLRARVEIYAHDQILDADNLPYVIVDGLKHVAFEDDGPEFVRSVYAEHLASGTGPKVTVKIRWE